MTLNRVWTPTKYYSAGGSKRLLVIHTMEGFTGPNGAHDCAVYFQGNVGASSHVCIDNNRGTIWEGVSRANSAWTQCNYNSVSVSMEQSGYASWSKSYWLNERASQLHNIADWIAEESARLAIPITRLNAGQAQGSGRGICGHSDLGSAGCGHSDPGANWPWAEVLEWARGGTTAPPQPEPEVSEMTPGAAFDGQGRPHLVRVTNSGQLKYQPPGGGFHAIDPAQSGATKGASIAIAPGGRIVVVYDNPAGNTCMYENTVDGAAAGNPWGWSDRGW